MCGNGVSLRPCSPPSAVRLSHCSRFGGCASKVGAADLARVLRRRARSPPTRGSWSVCDERRRRRVPDRDDLALVQTVDFFTPIVDDPYDFGRIAATNALSDVYAMGGTPITALNIAAFPIDTLDEAILRRILEGGAAVAAAAGVAILGGHTVKDEEPKYGMAVTGTIHPDTYRQQRRRAARRPAAAHQARRRRHPDHRAQARALDERRSRPRSRR